MPPDDGLTQDFDAHIPFAFMPVPAAPALANRTARVKRWFFIAFVESWLAVYLFRLKVRLRRARIPVLPGLCDLTSRALFNVSIGNAVEAGPGLMLTHGNVVIDGRTRLGKNCQINPWVTIGLSNSRRYGFSADGPTIGDDVHIGTGAKILGPITVGDYARVGANAVVIHEVAPNTTVVGVPARPVAPRATRAGDETAPAGGGPVSDERLMAQMRQAIIDYKLRRQSLRALVDTLEGSFESGSDRLRGARAQIRPELAMLEAAAGSAEDRSPQVQRSLAAIEAAVAP